MSQPYNWYHEADAPAGVPIIDLEDLRRKTDNPATRQNALKNLLETCRASGFFYVKNHGIDQGFLDEFTQESKRDIDRLSVDERSKYHHTKHQTLEIEKRGYVGPADNDQKCVFDDDGLLTVDFITKWQWGDVMNVAPTDAFGQRFERYYSEITDVARYLARLVCSGLQVPERAADAIAEGGTILQFLNYPDMPAEQDTTKPRLCAHTDTDVLTVLYQTPCDSGAVCLQAMIDGNWVGLPAIEGTMVVNFGEVMQSVGSNKVRATYHRVVAPPVGQRSGSARVSVAGFYRPRYDFEFQVPKDTKFTHIFTPGATMTYKDYLQTLFSKYYTQNVPQQKGT